MVDAEYIYPGLRESTHIREMETELEDMGGKRAKRDLS